MAEKISNALWTPVLDQYFLCNRIKSRGKWELRILGYIVFLLMQSLYPTFLSKEKISLQVSFFEKWLLSTPLLIVHSIPEIKLLRSRSTVFITSTISFPPFLILCHLLQKCLQTDMEQHIPSSWLISLGTCCTVVEKQTTCRVKEPARSPSVHCLVVQTPVWIEIPSVIDWPRILTIACSYKAGKIDTIGRHNKNVRLDAQFLDCYNRASTERNGRSWLD